MKTKVMIKLIMLIILFTACKNAVNANGDDIMQSSSSSEEKQSSEIKQSSSRELSSSVVPASSSSKKVSSSSVKESLSSKELEMDELFAIDSSFSKEKQESLKKMLSLINTEVDSNYVYAYEKTKLVPQSGKLWTIGLNVESIENYKKENGEGPKPSGYSMFWGVSDSGGITTDVRAKVKTENGNQNHKWIAEANPNGVIMSGMWMVGQWSIDTNTVNGDYDEIIRHFCQWAKSVPNPIYLKPGYEFDGVHNKLDPETYVKAFRRVRDICDEEGVTNVAYVWHSYAAAPYNGYSIEEWYPGDDYVDWVGVSTYNHMYLNYIYKQLQDVLDFAKAHKKPMMIAESSPHLGADVQGSWEGWFVNYFNFIFKYNIKAITYHYTDYNDFTNLALLNWKSGEFGENELLKEAWNIVLGSDYFLKESSALAGDLK